MGGTTCLRGASNGTLISDPYIWHMDAVTIVGFSPDGNLFLDHTLCLWHVLDGTGPTVCFQGHTSRVRDAIDSTLNPQWVSGAVADMHT